LTSTKPLSANIVALLTIDFYDKHLSTSNIAVRCTFHLPTKPLSANIVALLTFDLHETFICKYCGAPHH
jgi:hypothetical protein